MSRLENLLGAQALALTDRLLAGASESAAGVGTSSECAALVTLLAYPGKTVGWLGEVLRLTSSGVTRLVERLVAAGWVERSAGTDARRRQLELTPPGTEQAKRILVGRQSALSGAVAALSPPEQSSLERLLEKMVAGLADARLPALHVCRLCDRDACCGIDRDCPLQHTVVADPGG